MRHGNLGSHPVQVFASRHLNPQEQRLDTTLRISNFRSRNDAPDDTLPTREGMRCMAPDASDISCERCAGRTAFATQVLPLGSQAGARLYQCIACNRLTWVEWRGGHADTQTGVAPNNSGTSSRP